MLRDVVIVGGGPAGLATAIAAAERGLDVVVLDACTPPVDKACGEGLMPAGLAVLHRLGVQVESDGCAPIAGVRFTHLDEQGEPLTTARADFPTGLGRGVRRTFLHQALARRAADVGVELRFGVRVEGLERPGVRTGEGPVRARVVVGADGLHSRVRRWAGLRAGEGPGPRRFGMRQHFALAPWSRDVEVSWAHGIEAYVTPAGPERIGVAFLYSGGKRRFSELLSCFPRLARRLRELPVDSKVRGSGPLHQRVHDVVRGQVALVGDASGYLDAITGEGLSLALHQAVALAESIATGRLDRYRAAHRRIAAQPRVMMRGALLLEAQPWLRHRVFTAFRRDPELFATVLGLNDGSLGPSALGARRIASLLVGTAGGQFLAG